MNALKRPIQPIPADISDLLQQRGLQAAFNARPPYQRNDWLAWIARAKRDDTRKHRVDSMLAELEQGHGYMGMAWEPNK